MKMCPAGTKFFHVDDWTDMMNLTVAFHSFSNVPRNYSFQGQCKKENRKTAHISKSTSTGDCLSEVSRSYKKLHSIPYWKLSPVWCDKLYSQQSAIWYYCWHGKNLC